MSSSAILPLPTVSERSLVRFHPQSGAESWPETDHRTLTTLRSGSAADKESAFGLSNKIGWPAAAAAGIGTPLVDFTTEEFR